MTPPPDKIRPLVSRGCSDPDCEFRSTQEWAWLRHEQETGHQMEAWLLWPVRPWPE